MNLKGFADIDFFLQQLAMLKSGNAIESSIVTTGLRRLLTHVKTKAKGMVMMDIHRLNQSTSGLNGWEGMAADDEYYDCHPSNQTRTGVSVVVRDENNGVLRAAVFCLSSDLANEVFGITSSYSIQLGSIPADASILNETAMEKLEDDSTDDIEVKDLVEDDSVDAPTKIEDTIKVDESVTDDPKEQSKSEVPQGKNKQK